MKEDIHKHINQIINDQNKLGIPDFEGYSPMEMQFILYDTFGDKSPILLKKLADSEYQKIPIHNQIKFLADLINNHGELKLTNKGFLPTKIVAEIYNQGFLKDEDIELGISKLYKETDSMTIRLTRILLELTGIAKKRNNKLSLTKIGQKTLNDNYQILRSIFTAFGTKFNWAYFDGYGENYIGQLGFGFTLILLGKYGKNKRIDTFYADKYFKAYPNLISDSKTPTFEIIERHAIKCYSLRTFDRFLDYFGLIKIEQAKNWNAEKYISNTELYDQLIKCRPHKTQYS